MRPRTTTPLLLIAALAAGCGTSDEVVASGDPTGFTFESAPGSLASFGWSGEIHQIFGPTGTPFGVTTTSCQDGVCAFAGPSDPHSKVNRHRCLFRMSLTCTADTDCPVQDNQPTPCVYIYDAPIAQPLQGLDGKIGACAWSYIPVGPPGQPTIAGTINLTSGALKLDKLTVLLPLNASGPGTFYGACSECVRDPTPNDGIKGGTCQLATHIGDKSKAAGPDAMHDLGAPCDVNRSSTQPGFEGNYSMDCSPTVIHSNDPPLAFGGTFTSSGIQISLGDKSPRCTDGTSCFCGTCKGLAQACLSDTECPGVPCVNPSTTECDPTVPANGATARTCGKDAKLFPVYSNRCAAHSCNWDNATGTGTCMSEGDNKPIACYPSDRDIIVAGHAERDDHVGTVYNVTTGAASCIPLGRSGPLNAQLGLPGLLFQKRNFQIIPAYAEDK